MPDRGTEKFWESKKGQGEPNNFSESLGQMHKYPHHAYLTADYILFSSKFSEWVQQDYYLKLIPAFEKVARIPIQYLQNEHLVYNSISSIRKITTYITVTNMQQRLVQSYPRLGEVIKKEVLLRDCRRPC